MTYDVDTYKLEYGSKKGLFNGIGMIFWGRQKGIERKEGEEEEESWQKNRAG